MGKKKALQTAVCQSLDLLSKHLAVDSFEVSLRIVPAGDESCSLEEQVTRLKDSQILIPRTAVKNELPDARDIAPYAEPRRHYRVGSLAGVAVFFQHNPLVKPLLANNRTFEYSFWSQLIRGYSGFLTVQKALGDHEAYRYANRVLNNVRTQDDPSGLALDYAAQLMLKHVAKAFKTVVKASTTTELHELVPRPREALFLQYLKQSSQQA